MDALHRHIMKEDDNKHPLLLRWKKLEHQQSLTSDFKYKSNCVVLLKQILKLTEK